MAHKIEMFLALANQQEAIARHAAPRSILAAGLAYALAADNAALDGQSVTTATKQTLDTFAATLRNQGATKSEVSTKRKQAKIVGEKVGERFGFDILTVFETEADTVEGCFVQAYADGVKSVARLVDYMQHGDANHTDKAKGAAAAEKAAEKEAQAAGAVAEVEQVELPPVVMGEPVMPERVAKPEPGPEPVVEPVKVNLPMMLANMSDKELAELAEMVLAEQVDRAAETEQANVA